MDGVLERIRQAAFEYLDYVAANAAGLIGIPIGRGLTVDSHIIGLHEPPEKIEEYRQAVDIVISQLTDEAARSIITRHDWEGGEFILTEYHQQDAPEIEKPSRLIAGEPNDPDTWQVKECERFFNCFHAGYLVLDLYVMGLFFYYRPVVEERNRRFDEKDKKPRGNEYRSIKNISNQGLEEAYSLAETKDSPPPPGSVYDTPAEAIRHCVMLHYSKDREDLRNGNFAVILPRRDRRGEEPQYYHMLVQGKASNKLQKRITQKIADPAQLDLYGHGSIIEADFKLFIRGYKEIATVKQTAAMLLDSLMIQATKEGLQNTLVRLPLQDYMAMRGLKDEKEARAQVKQDINALERVSFEYKGIGKQKDAWLRISIAGGTVGQIKNGDIIFRFNQDWFDSFKESGKLMFMQFPREALQANVKYHPYTYWLARKLAEHKRMNIGKPNEDVISVNTLIAACPNFPSYEDVITGNRAVNRRIIEPFERDMDVLKQSLTWHYIEAEPPTDYKSFIAATIAVRWNAYPITKELEAAKVKRARRVAEAENPKPKNQT